MAKAICLRCGGAKRRPWQTCRRCGFTPETDPEDLIKSVYLSVGRFDDADRSTVYEAELEALAGVIRAGQPLEFDPEELARLREQKRVVESIPMAAVWGAVFRFLLPGFALLAVLVLIALLLRTLR